MAEESGDAAAEIEMDSCCGGHPSHHHVDLEVVNRDSEAKIQTYLPLKLQRTRSAVNDLIRCH